MENNGCMAARALKPSLCTELSMKPFNTQQLLDEFSSFNAQNVAVSVEDYFSVDCFLDLPVGHEEEEEDEEEKDSVSISSQEDTHSNNSDSLSSSSQEDAHSNNSVSSASLLSTHFNFPDEDLAELEWVSQFVDDSSSEFSLLYQAVASNETSQVRFEPEAESRALIMTSSSSNRRVPFLFTYQLPGKPRTTRPRPTSLSPTWSMGPSLTQSSCSSSLTPTSSSVSTPLILSDYINMVGIVDPVKEPAAKKPKREPLVRGDAGLTQFQRRCSHCLVQKTPQWRAGPLGPKTLCNACGVRYKSGRLFPEYRPACSPTFSSDVHSNSHRKVLEMRRRKETAQPVSGLSQMVPGF